MNEEDFNRKKKSFLASIIYLSDNIFRFNEKVMSDLIDEDEVVVDMYDEIKNLNWEEFQMVIKNLSFDQVCTVTIEANEK